MRIAYAVLFLLVACRAQAGAVLDGIKQSHSLQCGVVTAVADETTEDTHGDTSAFGADICRAVGAAVLGAHAQTQIHAFPSEALAYASLQKGEIALIVGATPDPGLARRYGVAYLTPVFFDGQGLMVHRDRGIASLRDLAGKHVCLIGTTDAALRLADATRAAGIKVVPFPFEEVGEMEAALVGGHCDAETQDFSKLAAGRRGFHGRIHDFVILPDRLSLDPFAPVVRTGDAEWARVVEWVDAALVEAEISGVTAGNAEAMRASPDTVVQTLTGARRGPQWGLGLADDWSLRAVEAAGNYGEVFARDLGVGSPMFLERGVNRPWVQGGMLWGEFQR